MKKEGKSRHKHLFYINKVGSYYRPFKTVQIVTEHSEFTEQRYILASKPELTSST